MGKNDHVAVADPVTKTSAEFGVDQFVENARLYRKHKRILDAFASSEYDGIDDCASCLADIVKALEHQIENAACYTPPVEAGFGSDNGSQLAEKLLGRQKSVGAIRTAFSNVGKIDK